VAKNAPTAAIGKDLMTASSVGGVLADAAATLGAAEGGLLTLYYGGAQRERDAQKHAAALHERFAGLEVEYYYGGQPGVEYWVSVER